MNRLRRRISELTRTEYFFLHRCCSIVTTQSPKIPKSIIKPLIPIQFFREYETQIHPFSREEIISLFSSFAKKKEESQSLEMDRWRKTDMVKAVTALKNEILIQSEVFETVLVEKGVDLFRKYGYGAAVVELVNQLRKASPSSAIQVLNWRRKQCESDAPMTQEEYSMGIFVAGRSNDMNLAVELYKEACEKKLKGTQLYNALMSAYLYNSQQMECQSVFQELKNDSSCTPNVASYSMVISALGRLMLIDQMEAAFRELNEQNLSPTIYTYKGLITGYVTARMWEGMEKTYGMMEDGPIKPNRDIHLLMLRGYADSDNLEKMEEMYEMLRDHVDGKQLWLIRCMVHAYCRSSRLDKVDKVEELVGGIPGHAYSPWLNMLLITLYAKEDLLEQMEKSISEALQHKLV